jgi:transposase
MRAYSQDLRERVARAVAAGTPKAVVARTFSVSYASVTRYVALQRANRSLRPGKSPGRPQAIPPAQYPALEHQLDQHDDATLAEHVAMWEAAHGVTMTLATMYRTIRRLGWTYQKRHWQPASGMSQSVRSSAPRSPTFPPSGSSPSTRPPPPLS